MNTHDAKPDLFAQIIDEWEERIRRGERPDPDEYAQRYPELADELRQVLPGLAAVEEFKGAAIDFTVAPSGGGSAAGGTGAPEQLGDYRILREIGRGGMGVVYEAEQISLGRHVALKVLPQKVLVDARQRRRFAREAKAAARLHHTNIVPVFGVGEHDGVPYYVMQFIQGLGLDVVLGEVKRLQETRPGATPAPSGAPTLTSVGVSAADVAQSLVTGEFRASALGDARSAGDSSARPTAPIPPSGRSGTGPLSGSFPVPGSTVQLPGQSGKFTRGAARLQTYWQSVGAIGVQVADALEHAHQQGILHRDIKPSNLLLDTRGTVWVTDFGLAKAADHQDDITGTGDVLGTLRYMPPEAFDGHADARGDVYALGLTIYELLALRPAFDERDRHALVKQLTSTEAPRLNRLNPDVPRDLVTVVHKAIEKDPARRYQTAAALAEDLQRFVDDEPIKARRVTLAERFVRWSRHNKGLATALGGVAALLLLSTIVSVLAMAYFWRQERLQEELAARQGDLAAQQGELAAQQSEIAATNARLLQATERERAEARRTADEQTRLKNEALAAKRQAEDNYRLAMSAVDQFLNKVTADTVLAGPGLQPLRKKLLQSALPFLDAFVRERAGDPTARGDLADALGRIGRITSEIGSPQEAVGHLTRAVELRKELLAGQANDRGQLAAIARDRESIGELYLRMNELGKATEALAAAESAWKANPDDPIFRSGVARVIEFQGDAAWADGESAMALQRYNQALSALSALSRDHPDHPEAPVIRLQLARAMGRFAAANVRLRQLGGAYASVDTTKTPGDFFHDAEAILEQLGKEHSKHERAAEFRRELARTREQLGEFEAAQRNLPASLTAYNRAAEIREQLARDNPLVTDYLADWATNLAGTAKLHAKKSDWAAVVAALKLAVDKQRAALKAAPEAAPYAVALADQLADLGKAEAKRDQRDAAYTAYRESGDLLEALVNPTREDLYAAAVARAWASRFAAAKGAEPTDEQKKLTTSAVTDLEKSIAAGFIELETLNAEPAFETVRADERFQKVAAGLTTKLADWNWHEDLDAARALAAKSGKDLLVYFSGSDWCVWCMVVRKGILGREEFLREAAKNYVLVILDTPKLKPQPANQATVSRMKDKWQIQGFPGFVVCDPELRRVGDLLRNRPTTVPAWNKTLQEIHECRAARDKAFAEARDADPPQRAQILARGMANIPKPYLEDYGDDVALAVYSAAIEQAPDDPLPYRTRAGWYLQRKNWRDALPDIIKAMDVKPTDTSLWIKAGVACLQVGDMDAYRKVCRAVVERTASTPDPESAAIAAKVLLLGPPTSETTPDVVARLDPVLARDPPPDILPWAQLQKGLAEYRAGNDQAAIDLLDKSLAANQKHPLRDSQALLVKTMSHQRLGQQEAAYDSWVQGRMIPDAWARQDWRLQLANDWSDILIAQSLRSEAEAAIKDNTMLTAGDQARAQLDAIGRWVVLKPGELKSTSGTTLTLQPDGSILAGGQLPLNDTYTLVADIPIARVVAIKLEALTDDSLPKKGPGREPTGNFLLSEFELTIQPKGDKSSAARVPVADAVADHNEPGFPAKHAIDGDLKTGWAVLPKVGEPHWAVFELKTPAVGTDGGKITITLKFQDPTWKQHLFGRFRVSVASTDGVMMAARALAALDADARIASVLTARGVAEALGGDPVKAAATISTALDRAADPDARANVAEQAINTNGVLEALVKLRPKEPELFLALARRHTERGESKAAAEARATVRSIYEERLAEQPDDEVRAGTLAEFLREGRSRGWNQIQPVNFGSLARANLTRQSDSSFLVSGTNPEKDAYMIYAPTMLKRVTAVRLEALPDPSLPHGASGRAPENGNFALSEFRMAVHPAGAAPRILKFADAVSDHAVPAGRHYAKMDMRIGLAIDGKSTTYWEGWPQADKPHWAVFRLDKPVSIENEMIVSFRLEFLALKHHGLGRFRIWVTDQDDPPLGGDVVLNPTGFAALGEGYAMIGEPAKAAAAFVKAFNRATGGNAKATILNQAIDAEGVLIELVKILPDDLTLLLALARYHVAHGHEKEAADAYSRAAAKTPNELNKFLKAGWWMSGSYPADPSFLNPFAAGQAPDPSKPSPAAWRSVPTGPQGRLDTTAFTGVGARSALALNYVHSPDERTATLLVSGQGLRIWVNGRYVYQALAATENAGAATDLIRVPVTLKAGRNILLVKATIGAPATQASIRLADDPESRGNDLAGIGLWKEAAEQYSRAIGDGTNHHANRMYALLLLMTGDRDGYRAHCQHLIDKFGSAKDAEPALAISHACCLVSEPILDGDRLVEMAERNTAKNKQPWAEFEVALALYRAGRFQPALARLDGTKGLEDWPKVWTLRALAHHRLGQANEARTWLKRAAEWYDGATREAVSPQIAFPFNPGWWEQPRFQLLNVEAHQTIDDPAWKDVNAESLLARSKQTILRPETYDYDLALLSDPTSGRLRLARGGRFLELKRPDEARADFDEAVKLLPKDQQIWRQRGQIEADLGDPNQAAASFAQYLDLVPAGDNWTSPRSRACLELAGEHKAFEKLMTLRLADAQLGVALARYHGASNRWKEAAAEMTRVIESRSNSEEGYELTAFLLLAGDGAGYEKAVRRLVERYKDSKEPFPNYALARACVLIPKSPMDPVQVLKWADAAVASEKTAWFLHVLAAAQFRAGNYAEALKRITESEAAPWSDWGQCENALLRAMIQAKQGEAGPAREALSKADAIVQRAIANNPNPLGMANPDWYEFQILRKEAEGLVPAAGAPK